MPPKPDQDLTRISELEAELRDGLMRAATRNPKARFTKRGRVFTCVAVVAVIAIPTGAIALESNDDDPFVPAEQSDPTDPGTIAEPKNGDEPPTLSPIDD